MTMPNEYDKNMRSPVVGKAWPHGGATYVHKGDTMGKKKEGTKLKVEVENLRVLGQVQGGTADVVADGGEDMSDAPGEYCMKNNRTRNSACLC